MRSEPFRHPRGNARHRRGIRARLLAAQRRRTEPAARFGARTGIGDHPDLPELGSAVGVAIMGTIIASATDLRGPQGIDDFVNAMKHAWYVGAGLLAAGRLLCQLFMPGGKQQDIE
jgi:hypothetical protein